MFLHNNSFSDIQIPSTQPGYPMLQRTTKNVPRKMNDSVLHSLRGCPLGNSSMQQDVKHDQAHTSPQPKAKNLAASVREQLCQLSRESASRFEQPRSSLLMSSESFPILPSILQHRLVGVHRQLSRPKRNTKNLDTQKTLCCWEDKAHVDIVPSPGSVVPWVTGGRGILKVLRIKVGLVD